MIRLRQSTASQEIPLGQFVDSTDGTTAETGLTIANTDIKVWKSGATTLANKNSGGATHISGGIYYCVLDATDTDTIGPLVIFVAVSGSLAVRIECEVLAAAQFDHLFGTDAPLCPTTAGRKLDVSAGGEAGIDWANIGSPTTAQTMTNTSVTMGAVATGAITRAAFAADTGLQSVRSNTAQAGASTTVTLDASASATTDFYKGSLVYLTGGTGAGQARFITAYNGTTKVATVGAAWATNPDATSTFAIIGRDNATPAAAIAAVQADTDDIQTRLPAALVSGRMDVSVGAMASGVLTATAIAADAITAAKVAADVTTELQTGLATASALSAVQTDIDDIQTRLPAALVSGRMDVSVGAMASGVVTATAVATDAIGAAEISAAACAKIADTVLRRTTTNAEASSDGDTVGLKSLLGAVSTLTHKIDASSGTSLVVYKADGTTSLGSRAITTDAAADPTVTLG